MTRVALVTGGGGGLGEASCEALAKDNFVLAVADKDIEAAVKVAKRLGKDHRGFNVDVSQEASVAALFDQIEMQLGPVVVVANFAGILIARDNKRIDTLDTSVADWQATFDVNSLGTFLVVREMLRRRRAKPAANARIITVSSLAGQVGGVRGSVPYAASKAAVIALTKAAAGDAGSVGVTVNCIAPGMVETRMMRQVLTPEAEAVAVAQFPLRRIGKTYEIGAVVSFLASEGSGFMTGATIDVNGGQLLR